MSKFLDRRVNTVKRDKDREFTDDGVEHYS